MARPLSPHQRAVLAGHQGDGDTARSLTGSGDPAVRDAALGALARTGELTEADLMRARTDEHPRVRRRAAEEAARFYWTGDDPFLLPLLDDTDPTVAEMAAWASGERVPPERGAVAALATMATGHREPLCREAAVAALGALGDDEGLPAILAATTDKPAVRRRAVIALAPFDGPAVDEALDRALADRDRQVRQAAEDQLPADRHL